MYQTTRRIAAFVLVLCFLGAGIGVVAQQRPVEGPAQQAQKLKDLLKKRADVARQEFEMRKRVAFGAGRRPVDPGRLILSALRLFEAELALSEGKTERAAVCESHLGRMREIEQMSAGRVLSDELARVEGLAAEYYRVDAEVRLEQEKAK